MSSKGFIRRERNGKKSGNIACWRKRKKVGKGKIAERGLYRS